MFIHLFILLYFKLTASGRERGREQVKVTLLPLATLNAFPLPLLLLLLVSLLLLLLLLLLSLLLLLLLSAKSRRGSEEGMSRSDPFLIVKGKGCMGNHVCVHVFVCLCFLTCKRVAY